MFAAACGSSKPPASDSAKATTAASGGVTYAPADVRFMQGMIGHHAQAIAMAAMAPTHGASDRVQLLCKKIDNSRLVRDADPKARVSCWSAIGAASLAVALLTGVLAPSVASTLAGYKMESLRSEERRLVDERRTLELQEAELLSPERLEKLAKNQNLVTPQSGQVVHLDGDKPESSVAMVVK